MGSKSDDFFTFICRIPVLSKGSREKWLDNMYITPCHTRCPVTANSNARSLPALSAHHSLYRRNSNRC